MSRERIRLERQCPFCGGAIQIYETTDQKQEAAGLVYLGTRCVPCNARIDAAGIGSEEAIREMDERLEKRRGTRPEDHRIKVRPQRRRRRR